MVSALVTEMPLLSRSHRSPWNFCRTVRCLTTATGESESTTTHQRIHLNHAGASPSPAQVVERVQRHTDLEQSVGGYEAAERASDELEGVYQSVADLIRAGKDEIALVESATVAWTRAFYAMADAKLREHPANKRQVILISDAEYAACVVPVCQWARDHGWTVLSIPSTKVDTENGIVSTGIVDVNMLQTMLDGKYPYKNEKGETELLDPSSIAMVCVAHVPTNSGIVNPVEEIGSLIADFNSQKNTGLQHLFYLVDSCQSVGQLDVDVKKIQCTALVATGRKYLRAPRGTGFLYMQKDANLFPTHVDHFSFPVHGIPTEYQPGDSIQSLLQYKARDDARRFEFWESNVANKLGLGLAVEHARQISLPAIEKRCHDLSTYLKGRLSSLPTLIVHHPESSTCGIVTFYSTRVDPDTIKAALSKEDIHLSVVPATSTPVDSANMKIQDLVRASISYTTTNEEIDFFVDKLSSVLESN